MVGGCTRDSSGVNQNAVADLEVRRILTELERAGFLIGQHPRSTDRAKIVHTELQSAVVQQIRQVLVGMPSLALNQSREFPEILQLGCIRSARPIAKNIRRLAAAISGPGRTAFANLLVESFKTRCDVRWMVPERILHRD